MVYLLESFCPLDSKPTPNRCLNLVLDQAVSFRYLYALAHEHLWFYDPG